MTNQTLFELMSEIDFDLIERAEAPVPLRKKPVFRVAMIAAALALVLTLSTVSAGVAGTAAVTVRYVDYVEQNYPEYDGTLLHFAQIFLTEDENLISSLLTEDAKHAIGGAIAALRENWGGIGGEQSKESTEESEEPEEQTSGQESETERGEDSTETIEPSRVFVHSSLDNLSLIAGDEEKVLFTLDTYSQWLHQVTLDDPNVTHIKLRGWLAFADPEPGIYGYSIDGGEHIYDLVFSQEAEEMVHVVSSYHGGKSCSRMEILVPVSDLAPGEHDIALRAKSSGGAERTFLTFTVTVPDGGEETETEPEITDEEPEQGWSEGLQYDMISQNGETVYVVSGIGICKDTDVYIPPTYRGYPVVAIGKEAFFSVLIDFVSVPSTVKEIGEYAFFDCSVKRVELSEGVEVIGDSAFADAYYLEEINFPSTLKTIGSYAFCATDLTQVILPDSVTEVHGHAFTSCLHVTEIRLSANLTEIQAYMLEGVPNVKSIELPRGIERIGEWAFMQCSRLETVTLYHGVLQIDDNIFEYCEDIKEIRFVGTQAEWESIDMSKKTREQLTPLVVYVEE